MPAIEAIYHTGVPVIGISTLNVNNQPETATKFFPRSCYLAVSGVTPGQQYAAVLSKMQDFGHSSGIATAFAFPTAAVTVSVVSASGSFALVPAEISINGLANSHNSTITMTVIGSGYAENALTSTINSGVVCAGAWSVAQDAARNIMVTCTSFGAQSENRLFYSYTDNANADLQPIPQVWKVALQNKEGVEIASQVVRPSVTTTYPTAFFPASSITISDTYSILISRRIVSHLTESKDYFVYTNYQTALSAPVTSGGGGGTPNMFSWLNNDYWWLTDLQVNLGTRAVTHRHGTLELRPNDTVNFAVLFHDGSAGKDPVATDLRLAVRSSSNASAYYFWANPSVTTTSVSGDIYYTITVTASDEDLLSAQAAGLLAGSNNSQTLLAEVQWTTTRGTFTSDTFNITVANEVVREPDV